MPVLSMWENQQIRISYIVLSFCRWYKDIPNSDQHKYGGYTIWTQFKEIGSLAGYVTNEFL